MELHNSRVYAYEQSSKIFSLHLIVIWSLVQMLPSLTEKDLQRVKEDWYGN